MCRPLFGRHIFVSLLVTLWLVMLDISSAFSIFLDGAHHVRMKYKNWSTDENWLPGPDDNPLDIFRLDDLGRQILPSGVPSKVPACLSNSQDLGSIRSNLNNLRKYMTTEENQWWDEFLLDPVTAVTDDTTPWFLDSFSKADDTENANDAENQPSGAESTDEISSPLGLVMMRERNIPQVQLLQLNTRSFRADVTLKYSFYLLGVHRYGRQKTHFKGLHS